MHKRLLYELKKSQSTASYVVRAQEALIDSGILELLREIGRARAIRPETPNYLEVQAMQTAWSSGYNQCLDDIMLFRQRFLEAETEKDHPIMGFGGIDFALEKDDLTKEEAKALRDGKPIPKHTAKSA